MEQLGDLKKTLVYQPSPAALGDVTLAAAPGATL